MGVEDGKKTTIDAVSLLFHMAADNIGFKKEDGSFVDGYISISQKSHDNRIAVKDLNKKVINTLILIGCNAGRTDFKNNLANTFLKELGIGQVIAADGTVTHSIHGSFMGFGETYHKLGIKGDEHFKFNQKDPNRKPEGFLKYKLRGGKVVSTHVKDYSTFKNLIN